MTSQFDTSFFLALHASASKLGVARHVRHDARKLAALVSLTSFLGDDAGVPERLAAIAKGLDQRPTCGACGGRVLWNPRRDEWRASCSVRCAARVVPVKKRKTVQKSREREFEWDTLSQEASAVEPMPNAQAAAFLRANCRRADGAFNGNLVGNPRNFIARFGRVVFLRVFGSYLLSARQEGVAPNEWAFLLENPRGMCVSCGRRTAFINARVGYLRACSTSCGNAEPAKVHAIRSKLLAPDESIVARRAEQRGAFEAKAAADHARQVASEGRMRIISALPPEPSVRQSDEFRYVFACAACGTEFESAFGYRRCYRCEPVRFGMEEEVAAAFPDVASRVNSRSVLESKRLQLDVFFPDARVAVEVDGVIWHSFGHGKGPLNNVSSESRVLARRMDKLRQCQTAGIRLLTMFDIEWNDLTKRQVWISVINAKLGTLPGIHARACRVERIAPDEAREFLRRSHLQGAINNSHALGLRHEGRLVSVMTFAPCRFRRGGGWELTRFANAPMTRVPGAASRLLARFSRDHEGDALVAYANRRWSDGALYQTLGFSHTNTTPPNYFYFRPGENVLQSRMAFQKHKLRTKLDMFDVSLTETENMYANGYRKIHDLGQLVFERKL